MTEDIKESELFISLLSDFYEKFLNGTAEAVEILANMERDYNKEYNMIKNFSEDPNSINELIENLSTEKQTLLLKLLLKSGKFARDFANLFNLSEEEKRKLANSLKEFSKELKGGI